MSSEAKASEPKKILIIGGGIAGLCAGVYARKCGYHAEVLEMNTLPGGLAMSWRRGEYTFETCLHWLLGSKPGADLRDYWEELFDISALRFVDPEEVARIETESGESLAIPTDPDRLEATLLARSPADAKAIRAFVGDVRRLGRFRMPYPGQGWAAQAGILLRDLPIFPTLSRVSKMTSEEYGARFQDPLIRAYFGRGELAQLSAVAVVFSLAWMSVRNAGYAIGGAQAIIRPIEKRLKELGGSIRYCARVERILVENGAAVGVQLAGGETLRGDWVISAADGHTTLNEMLGGAYTSPQLKTAYEKNARCGHGSRPHAALPDLPVGRAAPNRPQDDRRSDHPTLFPLRSDLRPGGQDRCHLLPAHLQRLVLGGSA
jgi:phytoene dehydrogenase-like protein